MCTFTCVLLGGGCAAGAHACAASPLVTSMLLGSTCIRIQHGRFLRCFLRSYRCPGCVATEVQLCGARGSGDTGRRHFSARCADTCWAAASAWLLLWAVHLAEQILQDMFQAVRW
jgi:hypothetical protein